MGNIRQTYIKRVAVELVQNHPDAFSNDFAANRVKVLELTDLATDTGDGKKKILYKKLVNRVAGYVTRYHRNRERKTADASFVQS
ncbi:MAG: 30S ribosomal protein S17e [Candidatus Thermoplasmatota archaeon]|jgi:small subunit ribosomal protein S17e|nr:30S ribosomal protein S17e [Candidatus Thermoplasmatota archaeon]MCL5984359.1 30S ribosomal protein S17e [Candidatus Thermoplasmatota archaeon]